MNWSSPLALLRGSTAKRWICTTFLLTAKIMLEESHAFVISEEKRKDERTLVIYDAFEEKDNRKDIAEIVSDT